MLVAGKYNIEVAFLVVSPVNQIEEQPGILFIELTVPHLVNNQTGRTYQTIEHRGFLASPSGSGELVPQLRHLNEIGLYSSLATRIAKSLRKMCLAGFGIREISVLTGMVGNSSGWGAYWSAQ